MTKTYRVRYSGSGRAYDTFSTLAAAKKHARFARSIGNTRPCVQRKLPSGDWLQIVCFKRRPVRKKRSKR